MKNSETKTAKELAAEQVAYEDHCIALEEAEIHAIAQAELTAANHGFSPAGEDQPEDGYYKNLADLIQARKSHPVSIYAPAVEGVPF